MKCTNCGHTIRPDREEAMKDKYGHVFCDMDCAVDFYIDLMSLAYVDWDKAETEENNNDNDT